MELESRAHDRPVGVGDRWNHGVVCALVYGSLYGFALAKVLA